MPQTVNHSVKPTTKRPLRQHWSEAPAHVVNFVSSRIRANGYVMVALRRCVADGFRFDRADFPTVVHDEIASLPRDAQQAVRVARSTEYNEEQQALDYLAGLVANGWIYGNRERDLADAAAAKAKREADAEAWVQARAIELEAADLAARKAAFIGQARAELERSGR